MDKTSAGPEKLGVMGGKGLMMMNYNSVPAAKSGSVQAISLSLTSAPSS